MGEKFENTIIKFSTNLTMLKKTLNKFNISNDIKCLTMNYCPSAKDANKFISNSELKSLIFKKFPSIVAIKIKIKSKFETKDAEKPKRNEFKSRDKVLILFESINDEQKIFYWKNTKEGNFLSLVIDKLQISAALKTFIIDFIINSLCLNLSVNYNNPYKELTGLKNSKGFNLIMTAVESDKIDILRELLKMPFNINLKTKEEKTESGEIIKKSQTAADIAWETKNQNILLEILKANSVYPKNFDESQCCEDIEDFLDISKKLHKAIKRDNQNEVIRILNVHKNLRYFFNSSNDSAAAVAINNGKISIYKILIQNNCYLSQHENFEAVMEELKKLLDNDNEGIKKIQKELKEIHKNHFYTIPKKHILVHMSNSFFGHDEENSSENFFHIREAFERIDKIKEGNLLLKINAVFKNVTNNFDFNRKHLYHMIPTDADDNTDGLFYFNGEVYFAAQKLTNDEEKFEVDGVMMHEHCHCALNKVFKNDAKPYAIDDELNEKKFKKIIDECYKIRVEMYAKGEKLEPILESVFGYEKKDRPAELIVRVPHILGYYQNNQNKIIELKAKFKSLFDYYDQIVMSEMEKTLTILEKLSDHSKNIKYNELTASFKTLIKHSIVYFQGVKVELKDITDEIILNQLTSQKIRNIFYCENLFIGKSLEKKHKFNVKRKFIDSKMNTSVITDEIKMAAQDFDTIINDDKRVFLLSDHAGTGKSTTLEYLSLKIKEKSPNKWIVIIDLKKHTKVFRKYMYIEENPAYEKVILILLDILSFSDALEIRIFIHLFMSGQIVFLFDGIDEIAPIFKDLIFTTIQSISMTKNYQCITTRIHCESKLTEILKNCSVYKLLPFDYKEAIEFVKEYKNSKGLTGDMQLVKMIIKQSKINENPLMLTMVVDLYFEGKLSIENFNIYSLYEATIEMKKDILIEKGEVANRDSNVDSKVNLWEIHQIYALVLVFAGYPIEDYLNDEFLNSENSKAYIKTFIDFNQFEVFKKWKREKSKWTSDMISRTGLFTIIGWDTEEEYFEFIHRTYAEFFVAKFLVENVLEALEHGDQLNESEFEIRMKLAAHMVKNFCDFLDDTLISFVRKFIHDYLSYNLVSFTACKKFNIFLQNRKTEKFIKIMYKNNDDYEGNYDHYEHMFYQLSSKFLKVLKPDKKVFNALTFTENNHSELFQIALCHQEISFLLCSIVFDMLKNSNLKNWHKLTGFGLNLNECQIQLLTDEALEILVKIDFLAKQDLFAYYKGGMELFDIWSDAEEISSFKQFYQFLYFITYNNDLDEEICRKLIQNLIIYFWFWILRSKAMIATFFEAAQKYFYNEKKTFANVLSEISKPDSFTLQSNSSHHHLFKKDSNYFENFQYFFNKAELFFQYDRELIKVILLNGKMQLFCLIMLLEKNKLRKMFQKYLTESEFKLLTNHTHTFSNKLRFIKVPIIATTLPID